jgi:O-antigen/teichoic acid export membrane protein
MTTAEQQPITPVRTALRLRGGARGGMLTSGIGLIAGRVASMALGFLAWLVAARLFAPAEVGVASGLVAAMMLCVQLALLGIGSAAIASYPRHGAAPARIVNTGATAVALTALVTGAAVIGLGAVAFDELGVIATPPYAAAFLAMTVFGTANVFFDHVSIALHRGDQVLVRNATFGVVTVAAPLGLSAVIPDGGLVVVVGWALAGAVACLLMMGQLMRAIPGYRPRLTLDRALGRDLVATGVPNWLLTLTERAPALLLPVLVAELFSPTTNAFWYAVWMMAWVTLIIPISLGQALFAETARHPEQARGAVTRSIRGSLALGLAGAAAMAVLAEIALGLLGPAYATAGALALRILVLTVVPFTLIQAYYAISRARGELREPIAVGAVTGLAAVVAALAAGASFGLVGMAAGWLAVHAAAGVWAAIRIRSLAGAAPLRVPATAA